MTFPNAALLLLVIGGCARTAASGGWEVDHGTAQSQTGPQSFATLRALGPPSSYHLAIECAPDGLQLSFGGRFSESGATLQFDDAPPVTVPTVTSRRGIPVVDLGATVGSTTVRQLLVDSSRVAVHSGPAIEVAFDVTDAEQAIRRLRCPLPDAQGAAD